VSSLLLRDSGEPDASKQAEEKLHIALAETPNDVIALRVLAGLLADRGAYGPLIQLIEPHVDNTDQRFRSAVLPLLLKAYDRTRNLVKAAALRRKLAGEESAE
jgi:lipopolysaccharide biosynthesis regulator YciM